MLRTREESLEIGHLGLGIGTVGEGDLTANFISTVNIFRSPVRAKWIGGNAHSAEVKDVRFKDLRLKI